MTVFIDANHEEFRVVPICRVLTEHGCPIAPNVYYAARTRAPCARAVRDVLVLDEVCRVHKGSRGGLYGAREVYHQLRREGVTGAAGIEYPAADKQAAPACAQAQRIALALRQLDDVLPDDGTRACRIGLDDPVEAALLEPGLCRKG